MIQSEGKENGLYWYLDWKGDNMIIHVEKENDSNICLEKNYEFVHKPIFGFDCWDVNQINEILDSFINKLSKGMNIK